MYIRIRRLVAVAATLVVVTVVSGCAESSRPVATGEGSIRGINAIVTAPEVGFLIEERTLANLNFKESSGFNTFDDLTYNFNFDVFLPLELEATRLATEFIDVVADHEYTVVLMGSIASPSTLFWEDPVREWDGTETVSEIFFTHLAHSIGELDFYFAAPGTEPVLGQAVGSLTSGDRLPGMDFEQAEYQLILTPKDDPATILYQSLPLTPGTQTRVMLALFEPDPTVPGNLSVNVISAAGASAVLADINFPPQVRTLHAAFGVENFDGYFDSDFTNIIYSDIGFKELSPYADTPTTLPHLTLTPVGNSGATIHEGDVSAFAGTRQTVILVGTPAEPLFLPLEDNARPLETFPVRRFVNTSVNTAALDIYILEPGTPIEEDTIALIRGIPSFLDTGFGSAIEGMREVTITLSGEITPISTPLILDLANGDIVDIVIVDTVDPAMVEMVVFDTQSQP